MLGTIYHEITRFGERIDFEQQRGVTTFYTLALERKSSAIAHIPLLYLSALQLVRCANVPYLTYKLLHARNTGR
jgi:hypothetical protein